MIKVTKVAHWIGHQGAVFALTKGENPHKILSGAGDGWVVEWDLAKPEAPGKLIAKAETSIYSLLQIPDERRLVVGNRDGGVHWIDLDEPQRTQNIAQQKKGIFSIQLFDNQLFTAGGDGLLSRWNVAKGRATESIQLSNSALRSVDFCPQRNEIAVGASDGNIYLLDKTTLGVNKIIQSAHQNSIFALQFSKNKNILISGGRDAQLKSWNTEDNYKEISAQSAHWFTINSIVFHPKGHIFATASRDKMIKIWDAENFELLKVIEPIRDGGHKRSVNTLFWSEYDDLLVSGSDDFTLMVWKIEL